MIQCSAVKVRQPSEKEPDLWIRSQGFQAERRAMQRPEAKWSWHAQGRVRKQRCLPYLNQVPLKYNCRLYGFFTKEAYNNNGTWCWILECNHMHLPLTDLGCTCWSLRRLVFCTASWIKEVATEMKSQHKTKFDLLKAGFLLGLHPRNYKYTSPSKYIYI